ncbi:DnaB-like helicase C-terminal domain-containing protein [Streptomyces sp. NPDC021100]|uniref:DnaB-like helicase C-terminal domain-containing protein n=1 Tax=Streptomyces sp. NPDC021100 TaxID=3365114 RepID=UPI0037AFB610
MSWCPEALFTLESRRTDIALRLLSAEARVALHHLRSGRMPEDAWQRLAKRLPDVAGAPLHLQDHPYGHFTELQAHCRRFHRQHGLRLIAVDDLQLRARSMDRPHSDECVRTIETVRWLQETAEFTPPIPRAPVWDDVRAVCGAGSPDVSRQRFPPAQPTTGPAEHIQATPAMEAQEPKQAAAAGGRILPTEANAMGRTAASAAAPVGWRGPGRFSRVVPALPVPRSSAGGLRALTTRRKTPLRPSDARATCTVPLSLGSA